MNIMTRIDLSIIIVSYNSKELTKKCLKTVFEMIKDVVFEVFVVDNASSDGSQEMVKKEFPFAKLIESNKNLGFAKANNLALPLAKGRYIFFLNPDTMILDQNIVELVKFMDIHHEAGAVGPLILNANKTMQRQCKRGFPTFPNLFFYYTGLWKMFPRSQNWKMIAGGYFLTDRSDELVCEVDQLSGAAMLVRRSIVGQIGGMNEEYVMYWDDTDYCFRIKEVGKKIYYVPVAKIVHLGGAGGSQLHAFKNLWYFHRGAVVFYRRYLLKRESVLNSCLFYAGNWTIFVFKCIFNAFAKEKIIGSQKPTPLKQ